MRLTWVDTSYRTSLLQYQRQQLEPPSRAVRAYNSAASSHLSSQAPTYLYCCGKVQFRICSYHLSYEWTVNFSYNLLSWRGWFAQLMYINSDGSFDNHEVWISMKHERRCTRNILQKLYQFDWCHQLCMSVCLVVSTAISRLPLYVQGTGGMYQGKCTRESAQYM